MFNSEEEVREFISANIPMVIYSPKAKKHICPFSSYVMQQETINCLTEKLWERQLTQEIINQAKQDDTRI